MVTTLHFHFSMGYLILTGGHSESGGLAALIAFLIGAAHISGNTTIDIPWVWSKNKAGAGRSSGSWGSSVSLLIKTELRSAKYNLFPSVVTVGVLTGVEGYLYQFVHLIRFGGFSGFWVFFFCSFQRDADSIPVQGIWFKSAETENNQDL